MTIPSPLQPAADCFQSPRSGSEVGDDALDLTPDTYPLTLKLALARRKGLLQAAQDQAVREGRAPLASSPASTLYSAPRSRPRPVHLQDPSPSRTWTGTEEEGEDAEPDPVKLAQGDAAWEAAKRGERATMAAFWGDDDDLDPGSLAEAELRERDYAKREYGDRYDQDGQEPQAGAERRAPTPPKPRNIEFGAELQGGLVNVLVPSSTRDTIHTVTCKRVTRNGVTLYAGLDCTCEDFAFRKRRTATTPDALPKPCKHIKAAEKFARLQAIETLTQGTKR